MYPWISRTLDFWQIIHYYELTLLTGLKNNIWKGVRILQFITFYQNALRLRRVQCITFYQSALRHEEGDLMTDVTPSSGRPFLGVF